LRKFHGTLGSAEKQPKRIINYSKQFSILASSAKMGGGRDSHSTEGNMAFRSLFSRMELAVAKPNAWSDAVERLF
jgi:hypothetical protein